MSEHVEWKIAVVDDSPADGALLRRYLRGAPWRVVQCHHLDEMLDTVRGFAPDVVLLDYRLPGSVGWEHLETLRRAYPVEVLAVAVWSGHGDEGIATEAMRLGAQDYLVKSELGAVSCRRALAQLLEGTEQARELALRERALLRANYELERANEQLHVAARERAALMAMVGHDMRGPLTSLTAVADAVRTGLDPEAVGRFDLTMHRLLALSQDLQSLGLLEAGLRPVEVSTVEIVELVERLVGSVRVGPYAMTHGLRLWVEARRPPVEARVDLGRLERMLGNLLENACRFARSEVAVRVHAPGALEPSLVIQVDDDGPGVPPARRDRIFERYVSAGGRGRGTGLGLAYVRQALSAVGGSARVGESPLGGARFTLVLPELDPRPSEPSRPTTPPALPGEREP